jgi:hypothetical protein
MISTSLPIEFYPFPFRRREHRCYGMNIYYTELLKMYVALDTIQSRRGLEVFETKLGTRRRVLYYSKKRMCVLLERLG